MKARQYVCTVEKVGATAHLLRRPVLRVDDVWVTVPHKSKPHAVAKLLRVECVYSEREAWRRYITKARAAAKNASNRVRWAKTEIRRATRGRRETAAELARVLRLAKGATR